MFLPRDFSFLFHGPFSTSLRKEGASCTLPHYGHTLQGVFEGGFIFPGDWFRVWKDPITVENLKYINKYRVKPWVPHPSSSQF